MSGFTAIISKKNTIPSPLTFRDKNVYGQESRFRTSYIDAEKYRIEHFTHNKFERDKTLKEDEQFVVGIEGVILNLSELAITTQQPDIYNILKQLYIAKDNDFIHSLKGEFVGFIYSKTDDKWVIFANPTGTKRLFYFQNEDYLLFSSDVRELTDLCHKLLIPITLDTNGAYLMLTYGYMLEDTTLVSEIKRVAPGSMLVFEKGELTAESYFNLSGIEKTTDTKEQVIEKMDELFSKAVRLEFEKDKEYNYKHIATLSGGLDSRMTVLVANKLGYKEQLNFTFSQSNYLDEMIPKKIASDYAHEFLFQSLDNGNYLKDIDKTIYYNDGLILYSGSSHVLKSIENINFDKYGLVHTGLIGDAVIGSFLSQPFVVKPTIYSGAYSTKLITKIEPYLQAIVDKYPSEELFKFYGRGFLAATNGNFYFDIFTQAVTPFLDLEFLSYCYSIPDEWKYKHKIYLEWIAKKHPEFAKYQWEKTGVSPLKSNNYKKYFDWNYYQRMKLKFFDKLSKKMNSGMNPFDNWFAKNPDLQLTFSMYFEENIALLSDKPDLKKDCEYLFAEGNTNERLQVLTLLGAIKLHFTHQNNTKQK